MAVILRLPPFAAAAIFTGELTVDPDLGEQIATPAAAGALQVPEVFNRV
jgi:hypothetical protein